MPMRKTTPLYPFGFGLSYTKYSYSTDQNCHVQTFKENEVVTVTVEGHQYWKN